MIYVSRQFVLPKPEIPGTTGLHLYSCIYLLANSSYKFEENILSRYRKYSPDPSLGSFSYESHERYVSEEENIL